MEGGLEKLYDIYGTMTDCHGDLKLSALLYLAQDAAGEHCKELALDWDTMAQKQMFWAVIRHRVQITRLPKEGEKIRVQTWPMPTTRVAFPRSTVAYDEKGRELFRAISIWVIMDRNTRGMILPAKSGIMVPGVSFGNELPAPRSLAPQGLSSGENRQVRYMDLDKNGHMNNTRYLDWVADLLPSKFYGAHQPKELVICYNQEALEGQEIHLQWELNGNGELTVDGHRVGQNEERVFSAQVTF